MTALEQVIESIKRLPPEGQRGLREWLREQEQKDLEMQQADAKLYRQLERSRQSRQWIKDHRAEFLGQWVALDGDQLVSHGADGRLVYQQAKAAGVEIPFVELVTEPEPSFFCGGWQP